MVEEWQRFLEEAGARIEDGTVKAFSDPGDEARAATEGNVVCDLSHYVLLSASGEDTETFLQGQTTNDLRHLSDSASQLNSVCTPKGRMMAVFRIVPRGDALLLRVPQGLADTLAGHLRKFVLMSKVTIEDVSDRLVGIGVSGPDMPERLKAAAGAVPGQVDEVVHSGDLTVVQVPGIHPRYEVYGEAEAMQALWSRLEGATPVGADAWGLLDIRAAVPTIYPETTEAFVPQMANLHLVNGVSFRKGCYTGQEIVARMQYLGQLKRRMYPAHVKTDTAPQPGDALFAPDSQSGQGAGKVVDARPAPEGGYDLLAVVEIKSAEAGELRLRDTDGPALELRDLPYEWETEI